MSSQPIPAPPQDASTTQRGLVSTGAQSIAGVKNFVATPQIAGVDIPKGGPDVALASTGDTSDRTAHLNAALLNGGHVYLGPGLYVVKGPIDIRSNTHLELHPGVTIRRDRTTDPSTQIFRISARENIVVSGGGAVLDGDKSDDPGDVGRVQMFAIQGGSSNITIRDVRIKDVPQDRESPRLGSYGDGVYINGAARVRLQNIHISGCERHGVFMVNCVDATYDSVFVEDTTGYEPGSAFNFEPNQSSEVIQNVRLLNCTGKSSTLGVTCNNHYGGLWHNIVFENCNFSENRFSGMSFGGDLLPGSVRVKDCFICDNGTEDFEGGEYFGLYIAGTVGARVHGCTIARNRVGTGVEGSGSGILAYDNRNLIITECEIFENDGRGIFMYSGAEFETLVKHNFIFNNGRLEGASGPRLAGVHVQGGQADSRLHFVGNIIGNKDEFSVQAEADTPTPGVQAYGVYLEMTDAWGVHFSDNDFVDNVTAAIVEYSPGNIFKRSGVAGAHVGNNFGFEAARVRGVYTHAFGAGGGTDKVALGQTSAVINATCVTGDLVQITPLDIDTNVSKWKAVCGNGSFTVTVNSAAAADWHFQWEITKTVVDLSVPS